jgi:glutathione S-transferase
MATTLYYAPGAASLVVHWLLIELQVPHTLVPLDFARREHKSEDYLKLNPAGVVPTLVIHGQAITEAAAIVMHLADLHPGAGLAPAPGTPQRASYYQWMLFMANTLQPAYRTWFYPAEAAGEAHVEEAREHARLKLESAWEQVARHLDSEAGPFLLGEASTAADFMLTMLMRWSRSMPRPTDRWPTLHAYANRMKAMPSYIETCATEGLTDWS